MTSFARKLAFSVAAVCLAFTLGAAPALAKTHHKHHVKTHHVRHAASRGSAIVRIAQEHLYNLGYYSGRVDGVMGSQTKAAIKRFQRDHALKADGVLGSRTNRALEQADHRGYGGGTARNTFLTHETLTRSDVGGDVNQDYTNSLGGGTKIVSSRFARVDVNESGSGADKRYSLNVNGQPVVVADGQPAIIGISQTYDLGNEDAVVLTTYSPNNGNCIYKNHVLALNSVGTKLLPIENCTRDYQARVDKGSLYVSFPENDDNRAFGATWRLQGTTLDRL